MISNFDKLKIKSFLKGLGFTKINEEMFNEEILKSVNICIESENRIFQLLRKE